MDGHLGAAGADVTQNSVSLFALVGLVVSSRVGWLNIASIVESSAGAARPTDRNPPRAAESSRTINFRRLNRLNRAKSPGEGFVGSLPSSAAPSVEFGFSCSSRVPPRSCCLPPPALVLVAVWR